jgi:hypothetical protein
VTKREAVRLLKDIKENVPPGIVLAKELIEAGLSDAQPGATILDSLRFVHRLWNHYGESLVSATGVTHVRLVADVQLVFVEVEKMIATLECTQIVPSGCIHSNQSN